MTDQAIGADILSAAAADAAAAPAAGEPQKAAPAGPPLPVDYLNEATQFVDFCATMFFPLSPTLATVYDDPTRKRIAGALAPVFQKYNFDLARLLGAYGPEIMLAATVLPLAPATIAAIKHDAAERRKAAAAAGQSVERKPAETPAAAAPASPLAAFPDGSAEK